MSENPYQSTSSLPDAVGSGSQQKPSGLTAVTVICLILGVMGIIGGVLGVGVTILQNVTSGFEVTQINGQQVDMQSKMLELQQDQFIPNLIINGCSLIVGSLLVIGAIGVLRMKESGRNLLRTALLVAAIFVVLRSIVMIWMQYRTMNAMKEVMAAAQGKGPVPLETIMQASMTAGIVIGLIWVAALVGFYLWSRSYLSQPSVAALFGTSAK